MSEVGEFDPFYRPRVGEIAAAREEASRLGGEALSFDDFIDLINPLHHLPFIGPLYREITGDEINPAVQVVGGAIFGGPVGMVSAVSQAIAEEATGKSLAGHALTALFGENDPSVADGTTEGSPEVVAAAVADVATEDLAGADTALPEIAPAAGAESTAGANVVAIGPETGPPAKAAAQTIEGPAGEEPLEGAEALRAFLRDRDAVTGGGTALPSSAELPDAVQKSHAMPSDVIVGSAAAGTSAPSGQASETLSSLTTARFLPVKPEHFTGRVAIRGPAGFTAESASQPGAAGDAAEGEDSPFATRMMEALKKYSALQDPADESNRQRSRLP